MTPVQLERTVKVELLVQPDQAGRLAALRPLVTELFNMAAAYAWEHKEIRGSVDLHRALYHPTRATSPLPAQFLCNTFRRVMGAVSSARKRLAKGQTVSCPHSDRVPLFYDERTMRLRPDRKSVSLSTLTGRIEVGLHNHRRQRHYADWQTTAGHVTQSSDGRWWLSLSMHKDVADPSPTGGVVGCDRGIVVPAALSDGRLLGDPTHHSIDRRYFNTVRSLQRKGTKSAKRRLKQRSGKWSRFRAWADHTITREILTSLVPGTTLAMEDLTNIRIRGRRFRRDTRRRLHAWSFRRQQTMLEYKAPEHGVLIGYGDARHTSQRCSACGHTARDNRRSRGWFSCRKCGHAEHADTNAAKNIAANWIATRHEGDPPVESRKGRVNPPYVAHAKDVRTPKVGGGLRTSGAAKRLRHRDLKSHAL